MKTQSSYKPAVLLGLLDAIQDRVITQNAFSFEELLPFAQSVLGRHNIDAGEKEVGYGFFHLAGEYFWLLAYDNPKYPLSATPSPTELRTRVRHARLKEPFFELLRNSEQRSAVREVLLKNWFEGDVMSQFYILRSNQASNYDDDLGTKYAYTRNFPNWTKLGNGARVILDRKLKNGQKVLLGYGTLSAAEELGQDAEGVAAESEFERWTPAREPYPSTRPLSN